MGEVNNGSTKKFSWAFSEEFEVCSNHKFKYFLIELDEIFNKWSIDYINYESDYDDYIEY